MVATKNIPSPGSTAWASRQATNGIPLKKCAVSAARAERKDVRIGRGMNSVSQLSFESIYEHSKCQTRAWPSAPAIPMRFLLSQPFLVAAVAAAATAVAIVAAMLPHSKWLIRFTGPWPAACSVLDCLAYCSLSCTLGSLEGLHSQSGKVIQRLPGLLSP